jgi:hypothetical protein
MMDAGLAIAGARKKLDDAMRQRDELFRQWNVANEEVKKYQYFLDVWSEFSGEPTDPSQMSSELLTAVRNAGSMADAAVLILRAAKDNEAEIKVIVRQLEAGEKVKGKNTYSTVLKTLQRYRDRFENPRRGVWKLVQAKETQEPQADTSETATRRLPMDSVA